MIEEDLSSIWNVGKKMVDQKMFHCLTEKGYNTQSTTQRKRLN